MATRETHRKDSPSVTPAHEDGTQSGREVPRPTATAGRRALRSLLRQRSMLAALGSFHDDLGDVFRISLGAFSPVFMVGPEASRYVLVTARDIITIGATEFRYESS